LIAAWGFALPMPFISDDYAILARVRDASFAELWSREAPLWAWYRPWSRELHFWMLQRTFGANPLAFHIAAFGIWLAALMLFFTLVRRLAGARAAGIAAIGFAAMSSWSGALLWAAGVQELWLLLFGLLYLQAVAARRLPSSLVFLAGALLSKETAAILPVLAVAWMAIVERARPLAIVKRITPALALIAIWVVFHPTLLARVLRPGNLAVEVATHTTPAWLVPLQALLGLVNLSGLPRPVSGWTGALLPALPAIGVAIGFAIWGALGGARATTVDGVPSEPTPSDTRRAAWLGVTWAVLAWLPLVLPSIDWHPYYALFGAAGAWLALGVWLARVPRLAVGVIAITALLQPLQGDTSTWSFSASLYQRRQAFFIGRLRDSLLEMHPTLPPHSRLYFARVPHSIGLGYEWFAPAFEVWYRDSTISGGFWSSYRRRPAAAPPAPDLFFRYDSTDVRWVEISRDPATLVAARATNPRWREDHRELAATLARAEDWNAAAAEFELLYTAYPDSSGFAMSGAVAAEVARDSVRAARLYAGVLRAPDLGRDDADFARGFAARWRSVR
jgi:hypothetical protein